MEDEHVEIFHHMAGMVPFIQKLVSDVSNLKFEWQGQTDHQNLMKYGGGRGGFVHISTYWHILINICKAGDDFLVNCG